MGGSRAATPPPPGEDETLRSALDGAPSSSGGSRLSTSLASFRRKSRDKNVLPPSSRRSATLSGDSLATAVATALARTDSMEALPLPPSTTWQDSAGASAEDEPLTDRASSRVSFAAISAPPPQEPSQPSALFSKQQRPIATRPREQRAETLAAQLVAADTADELSAALHALAALSSAEELTTARLAEIIRTVGASDDGSGMLLAGGGPGGGEAADGLQQAERRLPCLERLCSCLSDVSPAVQSAALVLLGNFGAEASSADLMRLRTADGTSGIFRLICARDTPTDTLTMAAGACMNLLRYLDEAMAACREGVFVRLQELAESRDETLCRFSLSALANVRACVAACVADEPLLKMSALHGESYATRHLDEYYDAAGAWLRRKAVRAALARWAAHSQRRAGGDDEWNDPAAAFPSPRVQSPPRASTPPTASTERRLVLRGPAGDLARRLPATVAALHDPNWWAERWANQRGLQRAWARWPRAIRAMRLWRRLRISRALNAWAKGVAYRQMVHDQHAILSEMHEAHRRRLALRKLSAWRLPCAQAAERVEHGVVHSLQTARWRGLRELARWAEWRMAGSDMRHEAHAHARQARLVKRLARWREYVDGDAFRDARRAAQDYRRIYIGRVMRRFDALLTARDEAEEMHARAICHQLHARLAQWARAAQVRALTMAAADGAASVYWRGRCTEAFKGWAMQVQRHFDEWKLATSCLRRRSLTRTLCRWAFLPVRRARERDAARACFRQQSLTRALKEWKGASTLYRVIHRMVVGATREELEGGLAQWRASIRDDAKAYALRQMTWTHMQRSAIRRWQSWMPGAVALEASRRRCLRLRLKQWEAAVISLDAIWSAVATIKRSMCRRGFTSWQAAWAAERKRQKDMAPGKKQMMKVAWVLSRWHRTDMVQRWFVEARFRGCAQHAAATATVNRLQLFGALARWVRRWRLKVRVDEQVKVAHLKSWLIKRWRTWSSNEAHLNFTADHHWRRRCSIRGFVRWVLRWRLRVRGGVFGAVMAELHEVGRARRRSMKAAPYAARSTRNSRIKQMISGEHREPPPLPPPPPSSLAPPPTQKPTQHPLPARKPPLPPTRNPPPPFVRKPPLAPVPQARAHRKAPLPAQVPPPDGPRRPPWERAAHSASPRTRRITAQAEQHSDGAARKQPKPADVRDADVREEDSHAERPPSLPYSELRLLRLRAAPRLTSTRPTPFSSSVTQNTKANKLRFLPYRRPEPPTDQRASEREHQSACASASQGEELSAVAASLLASAAASAGATFLTQADTTCASCADREDSTSIAANAPAASVFAMKGLIGEWAEDDEDQDQLSTLTTLARPWGAEPNSGSV